MRKAGDSGREYAKVKADLVTYQINLIYKTPE